MVGMLRSTFTRMREVQKPSRMCTARTGTGCNFA